MACKNEPAQRLERLYEDAKKFPCAYFGRRNNCKGCRARKIVASLGDDHLSCNVAKAFDLMRRQRKELQIFHANDFSIVKEEYMRLNEAIAELAVHASPDIRTLHSVMMVVRRDPPSSDWYLRHAGFLRAAKLFGFRKALKAWRRSKKEAFHER